MLSIQALNKQFLNKYIFFLEMNLFTKSSFCLVDKEYWQEIDTDYFVLQKQLQNNLENIYRLVGRNLQYREKEPFQYPKFYNYQSLMAIDCFTDQYLNQINTSKRSRLNWKNLLLSIYIKTKAYHQGFSETINSFYEKYYRSYSYNNSQLIIQKQFLHKLQSFMSQDYDQLVQLDEMIEKNIEILQETILQNEKLELIIEQNMNKKLNSMKQQQLVSQLNQLFIAKIVSIVECEEEYKFIEEYPTNQKIGIFNFYKVKFQPDYNKYEIYIDAEFLQRLIPQKKLKEKIKNKNLQNGKYCHICKEVTQNQKVCKIRMPLPIPKQNASTVDCGKVYCTKCYTFRQQRLNMEKKELSQSQEESEENVPICLSCSGECQCQICLKDQYVTTLYKTLQLQKLIDEKLPQNYYLFYRNKTQ